MTEHDMLLYFQKQIEGLKAQVAGLVIERDVLAARVADLEAEVQCLTAAQPPLVGSGAFNTWLESR